MTREERLDILDDLLGSLKRTRAFTEDQFLKKHDLRIDALEKSIAELRLAERPK